MYGHAANEGSGERLLQSAARAAGVTELDLECVEVAASAVCDFDFLFAFVFGDEPFKGTVAHALRRMSPLFRGGEGEWVGAEFYRYVLGDRVVDDERHAAAGLR